MSFQILRTEFKKCEVHKWEHLEIALKIVWLIFGFLHYETTFAISLKSQEQTSSSGLHFPMK